MKLKAKKDLLTKTERANIIMVIRLKNNIMQKLTVIYSLFNC
jgi:hypothetical protein